jgi:hypothetical protein
MKIEFTRAEIERIILGHLRDEIAPYVKFQHPVFNDWGLPDTILIYSEEENAAQ